VKRGIRLHSWPATRPLRGPPPMLYRHFESIICENAIVKYSSEDTRDDGIAIPGPRTIICRAIKPAPRTDSRDAAISV